MLALSIWYVRYALCVLCMAGERKRGGCKGASERKENKGASMDDTRKMLVMPKILDTGSQPWTGEEENKVCMPHAHLGGQW